MCPPNTPKLSLTIPKHRSKLLCPSSSPLPKHPNTHLSTPSARSFALSAKFSSLTKSKLFSLPISSTRPSGTLRKKPSIIMHNMSKISSAMPLKTSNTKDSFCTSYLQPTPSNTISTKKPIRLWKRQSKDVPISKIYLKDGRRSTQQSPQRSTQEP